MSNTIQFSCQVGNTNTSAKLGLEIWLDDNKVYDNEHVDSESAPVKFEIPDEEADHELRFIMKNKTAEHTQIDADGNIVSDARLTIADLMFDEIKPGLTVTEQTVYTHDFNGTGEKTKSKFYGEMGCNGTVSLKFTTPIYSWLLEHL